VFGLVVLIGVGIVLWTQRDALRAPEALYRQAQTAPPGRAAQLYDALAEKAPELEEYARLWAAEARMPDLDAVRTLRAIVDFRPQSPAAYRAHVALARYYATLEAPQAEDAYGAALELHDTVGLRVELARYMEERGDDAAAYAEYRALLSEQHDAFAGMRRTAPDPLTAAEDLNAAYFFSDAVEVLRDVDDAAALPLRARALEGVGRYQEAREAYEAWLEQSPDDEAARQALAEVLQTLGVPEEMPSPEDGQEEGDEAPPSGDDGGGASEDDAAGNATDGSGDDAEEESSPEGEPPEPEEPDEVELHLESSDPVDWWTATTLLETQGRLTQTLPVYARVARTDTYLADDAAYRLYVLADRLGDEAARAQAEQLLSALDMSWLVLRATDAELRLPTTLPLAEDGGDILAKAEALESIGRPDLARLELLLAARARRTPEVDLAMARALDARGYVLDAQPIAERYIGEHGNAPRGFWALSYPRPYSATVRAAAAEFDVDPLLIWSIMRQESRYDPGAFGYVAERGLMQILPTTQEWIAGQLGEEISPGDAFTPQANIRMGAWYLRHLLDYYDGDHQLAITAYNGGPGNVDSWREDPLVSNGADFIRWIGFGSTREYLETVSVNHRVYQALYGGEAQ
jgi:soluble lytic murein transglycosylase